MVGVVSVVLIAGCSSAEPGQPTAGASIDPSQTPTTSASASGDQAPPVRTALNDARVVADPCSTLTSGQLQGIGFTASVKTKVEDLPVGNVCNWNDDTVGAVGASTGVGVQTTLIHGLSDIYAQRRDMAYFIPVTIEGYPAVLTDLTDQRDSGTCALNLGVSDTSVMSINYQQEGLGPSACDKVQAVARAVVETLRGT